MSELERGRVDPLVLPRFEERECRHCGTVTWELEESQHGDYCKYDDAKKIIDELRYAIEDIIGEAAFEGLPESKQERLLRVICDKR